MKNYGEIFNDIVKQEGYELLSEYKNSKIKVLIRCKKGHEYKVKPNDFKNGNRCPICSGLCPIQAKEQFIELVERIGYELLSEYKNSKIKVLIRCKKGHEYKAKPNDFKNGNRCPVCSRLCPKQAKKQFIELLHQKEYKLLSEYTNNKTKVLIRCDKGHEYKVKPNDFKSGNRCPKCSNKCPIQAKEQFIELLVKERYILIGEYKNVATKVKLRCNYGHEYKVKPNDFKSGSRCPICSNKCPEQAKEQFLELLVKERYKLIGEYKNNFTKVLLRCPNNHEWDVRPSNLKYNYSRCPHCKGSTGQRKLQEMLLEYELGKVIYNDREVLGGLELDIYYPELRIGIEYQGNYWHSLSDQIVRDKRKRNLCKELDIKLIEIWDNDFMKDQEKELYKIIGLMSR